VAQNTKLGAAKRDAGIIASYQGAQARIGLRGGLRSRVLVLSRIAPPSIVLRHR
jgi:hypothetical protein